MKQNAVRGPVDRAGSTSDMRYVQNDCGRASCPPRSASTALLLPTSMEVE